MFQSILWLQKLTYAASADNNRHNPPSDGANVDEYECVQNEISYETPNYIVSFAAVQPFHFLVFNLCSASSVRYITASRRGGLCNRYAQDS